MRHICLLVQLLCLSLAPSALAQEEPGHPSSAPAVRYKEVTEIDAGELRVDGTIEGPLGSFGMGGLPGRSREPLVALRADFDAEMIESVATVR